MKAGGEVELSAQTEGEEMEGSWMAGKLAAMEEDLKNDREGEEEGAAQEHQGQHHLRTGYPHLHSG